MSNFIKNKAKAAAGYVADTTSAVVGYVGDKVKNTAEWYADMRVTPREKVIATLGGIAGVGAAWAAFTLGFGSAPISALTLGVTPLATTVLTGLAVGMGIIAKKIASGTLNLVADGVEALAATHPDRRDGNTYTDKAYRRVAKTLGQGTIFDRALTGEYRPTYGPEGQRDHQLKEKHGSIDATEKRGLTADLRKKTVETYTRPTLFSGERSVEYTISSYTAAELKRIPEATTRQGKKYR